MLGDELLKSLFLVRRNLDDANAESFDLSFNNAGNLAETSQFKGLAVAARIELNDRLEERAGNLKWIPLVVRADDEHPCGGEIFCLKVILVASAKTAKADLQFLRDAQIVDAFWRGAFFVILLLEKVICSRIFFFSLLIWFFLCPERHMQSPPKSSEGGIGIILRKVSAAAVLDLTHRRASVTHICRRLHS